MRKEAGEMFAFRGKQVPGLIADATLKDISKYSDDVYASMDAVIHILADEIGVEQPPRVDEEIYLGNKRYKIVKSEYKDWSPAVYHLFVKGDVSR